MAPSRPKKSPYPSEKGINFLGPDSKDRWRKGKQSSFTEELGERIIDFVWSGECKSLMDVERQEWGPKRRTLHLWKKKYPEFGAALEEAQIALADVYVDEIEKIKDNMLAGIVDPSAANVAIRSNQWKAQVVDPQGHGNKRIVENNSTVKITTQHVNRIEIDGLSDEQLDALEAALNGQLLLTGPVDGDAGTTGED